MSVARTAVLTLLSTAMLSAPAAFAQKPPGYEPGEKWRTTMSMSAMGMSMPGQTTEVCVLKGGDQTPVPVDKNCQVSDHKRSGNKESFRMACTGKDAMKGTMEIVYESPDHYRGKMLVESADGEMTMNYDGRKLPGECDAGEMKRKLAAAEAQGNAQVAKTCREGAQNGQTGLFTGAAPACKDPKDKQVFCSNVQGYKIFGVLSQQERYASRGRPAGIESKPLMASAKACGFNTDAKRAQLCGGAEGKGEWAFLANECPALAKPLAQRECAGRGFTTPVAPQYQAFCSAYAQAASGAGIGADNASSGAAAASAGATQSGDADTEEPEKKSVGDKAKDSVKKLRGLLGH